MTRRKPDRRRKTHAEPDIEETRKHIMAAGKELLFAAHGALRFCKQYVETSVAEASQPHLLNFFDKAIAVADELGNSIAGVAPFKRAAERIARPLFTAMGHEMMHERTCCGGHHHPAHAAKRKAPRRKARRKSR